MITINVLIVTYKQAHVIARTIESVLKQKEYGLKNLIICDDCSPDNNWEIITDFVKQYPDTIIAYRNESNLGIYGNSNKLVSLRGEADAYYWLEGDDELKDGFFKSVQETIKEKGIDIKSRVGIMSSYSIKAPDGKETIVKNDYLDKHNKNPYGAYMRGLVSWRSTVFSAEVIKRFQPVEINKGLALAESQFDSQWFKNVETIIFNPYVGSVYYAGIGVSKELTMDSSYRTTESLIQHTYSLNSGKWGVIDRFWIKGRIAQAEYCIRPSFIYLIKYIFYYLAGSLGYKIQFRKLVSNMKSMIILYLRS
jgi:glycosyltransferase involved in cell wall biosynthesis